MPNTPKQGVKVAATYTDRLPRDTVEAAIRATKGKFNILFGNATIDKLNAEQTTYFAQQLFPDKKVDRAFCAPEMGTSGFNEFFIEAFSDSEE